MLDILLRYVTLSKTIGLDNSISTDGFYPDSVTTTRSRSIGSFRESEDSILDLISITDEVNE